MFIKFSCTNNKNCLMSIFIMHLVYNRVIIKKLHCEISIALLLWNAI